MHDIRWVRENVEKFGEGLIRRGMSPSDCNILVGRLLNLDQRRRAVTLEVEEFQKKQNEISREIGRATKISGAAAALAGLRDNLILLKTRIQSLEKSKTSAEEELKKELEQIPNIPFDAPDVPTGQDSSQNRVEHKVGEQVLRPKQHFELGEALGQMNFELAAKLSGARFVVLLNGLARLERALGQFMLDVHTTEHGYTEISPPLLVRDDTMRGTAQLPKFADDQFKTVLIKDRKPTEVFINKLLPYTTDAVRHTLTSRPDFGLVADEGGRIITQGSTTVSDVSGFANTVISTAATTIVKTVLDDPELNERLWLIPTAEVPLTNLVRDSIVEESSLPLRLTACTPCFRQEAGAAGKDTRGMIRQHQFTKVELVSVTTPDKSREEHERMLACAEEVLKKLELHYRVVTLCTGDMGFAAQKTYDIEVWLPGQGAYREISSCSNCGEFQARRMNARYRPAKPVGSALLNTTTVSRDLTPAQPRFVHTLNGSGVAVGRALIAVMETYQQENGSIAVPSALAPYMGGLKVIERA